ncbi:MAG: protease modulator HflC [Methylococcales bacterium]
MIQIRLLLVAVVLVLAYLSVFIVEQTEKAILFQFGKIVRYDFKPGLHFKIPIYNDVKFFDARILNLDAKPELFLTSEKKNVVVDTFVKWRIDNVSLFYTTMSGDQTNANLRIDQIMKDAMRSEFSKRSINQVVSADRFKLRDIFVKQTHDTAEKWGIQIVDVRIKRINLPEEVSDSVYQRMKAERVRIANEFRSQGKEINERIQADADKQREIILAEAFRDAEISRGQGDAIATDIYANAYGRNADFYTFYRSLNAYKKIFSDGDDRLILEPSSDFFKYFGKEQ